MFKLIPDAKISWRFTSVQATALLAFVSSVQAELFPLLKPLFTAEQWGVVLPAWVLLILVLRHIAQPGLQRKREQLELDQLDAQDGLHPEAAFDAQGQDVDGLVEGMAQALYAASGLPKLWANVSPESQERWRIVAAAALARNRPAQATEGKS